jgi:hypothetical protein
LLVDQVADFCVRTHRQQDQSNAPQPVGLLTSEQH